MSVTEAELQAAMIAHEVLAERGPQGERGEKGDPGLPGADGINGRDGVDGVTGPKGDRGPIGADGAIGPRGERGAQGIPGVDGRVGRDGTDGRNGVDGLSGTDGSRGPRGYAGPQGEKGDKGEPGPAGASGTSWGGVAGLQIMAAGAPVASQALSIDFGSGVDVVMDRNVARVTVAPTAGSDVNYVHTQTIASDVWDIAHNLGKRPSVTVVTSAGDVVEGDIHYVDDNTVQLAFGAPFGGFAYLN